MREFAVRAANGFGVVGVVACAIRQLPPIWEQHPLDAVIVGAALAMAVSVLVLRVFGDRVFG